MYYYPKYNCVVLGVRRVGRGSLFLDPTRPDPAQSFYAVPKSKNAIFH